MRWGFSWKSWFDFLYTMYTNSFKMGRFPIWFDQSVRDWGEKRWDFFLVFGFDFQLQQHANHGNQFKLEWNDLPVCYMLPCRLSFMSSCLDRTQKLSDWFFISVCIRIQSEPHSEPPSTNGNSLNDSKCTVQRLAPGENESNKPSFLFHSIENQIEIEIRFKCKLK